MNFNNLLAAIEQDDFEAIKEIKKHHPSLNTPIHYGFTPLEWAYLLGKSKAAGILETRTPKMIKIDLGEGVQKINPSEFPHFFQARYFPHLEFESRGLFEKVRADAPLYLRWSPLGAEVCAEGKQYREEISVGYFADTVIRWIDDDLGYGLFAGIDFIEGDYIGEYTGKVRRIVRSKKDLNPYCVHYPTKFFSWNYTLIDAQDQGNESRFINHSSTPNLTPHWVYDRGLMHLVLKANRFISKGTQLTIDYGKDFWRNRPEMREIR